MQFPRWMHQAGGATRLVADAEACAAAQAEGWSVDPVPVSLMKGEERVVVYTADALAVALADGWTRDEPPPVEKPTKGKRR